VNKTIIFVFFFLFTATGYCATPLDSPHESATPAKNQAIQHDIPYKRDSQITASLIARVVASLVLVLFIAAGIVYVLKHYLPGWRASKLNRSSRISVIETKRLTPKTLLFLIQVDGETLLLAQSNDRVTTLTQMENAAPAANTVLRTEP
jgi:flagellar biogenesis protein FliO